MGMRRARGALYPIPRRELAIIDEISSGSSSGSSSSVFSLPSDVARRALRLVEEGPRRRGSARTIGVLECLEAACIERNLVFDLGRALDACGVPQRRCGGALAANRERCAIEQLKDAAIGLGLPNWQIEKAIKLYGGIRETTTPRRIAAAIVWATKGGCDIGRLSRAIGLSEIALARIRREAKAKFQD